MQVPGQVRLEDSGGELAQVLFEDGREGQDGRSGAEPGALQQTLFVEDEQVGAGGQHGAAVHRRRPPARRRRALRVGHEAFHQLRQVP